MATRTTNKPGPKKKTQSQTSNRKKTPTQQRKIAEQEDAIKSEILLIVMIALAIFLFLCNFDFMGTVGVFVSGFMFGLFGLTAYIAPVLLCVALAFNMVNHGNFIAVFKLFAGLLMFLLAGMVAQLLTGTMESLQLLSEQGTFLPIMKELYQNSSANKNGGGIIGGYLAFLLHHFMGMGGTIFMVIILTIICLVVVTERSFLGTVKKGSQKVYETAREDADRRRERSIQRREEWEARQAEIEARQIETDAKKEEEQLRRIDKKVSGVMMDTILKEEKPSITSTSDDIHEIILKDDMEDFDFEKIHIKSMHSGIHEIIPQEDIPEIGIYKETKESFYEEMPQFEEVPNYQEAPFFPKEKETVVKESIERHKVETTNKKVKEEQIIIEDPQKGNSRLPKKYRFPPVSLLARNENKGAGDSAKLLKETAMRLQKTLLTFGVKVTITDISQGPTVTRYELQPEQGVKVSKIVGLADDIKLNLAATDIRIEAPIPGKAAIGIEVPNKENSAVSFRDLLESKEFKEYPSNLTFAVGKDIGGQTIVADIAKMPHMLIAGATGSGKSVCINTLIMSILYKAHPDDVKLIMIDPKVVELSVYNGIPHLLIPVVTDPKKAAAALHWGVAEMTDRYQKFADYNVRDLKGYNKKIEGLVPPPGETAIVKMPQVVIIVDELADLMMVAPGEVEESICRLAQLARAAGIHLIIATQRPSVDVITGLIKANMPSRVAFSVSSGVDSRTILDMNGAEKLLGKGDMLFYPQGYPKPARIQGAFISDREVSDVVDFLKNQVIGNTYSEDIEEKISTIGTSQGSGGSQGEERDMYFVDAAKFIIEKDKASIGMLQRVFKIGFNRAARIMDQLAEAGVVGEEEGTKPRKVLMSPEQFECYIEEM